MKMFNCPICGRDVPVQTAKLHLYHSHWTIVCALSRYFQIDTNVVMRTIKSEKMQQGIRQVETLRALEKLG